MGFKYVIDDIVMDVNKHSVDIWLAIHDDIWSTQLHDIYYCRSRKVTVANPPPDPFTMLGLRVYVDGGRLWLGGRVWAEWIALDTIQLLPEPKEESCNSHPST